MDDEQKSPEVDAENKAVNPTSVTSDDNATVQINNIHVGGGDESNGDSRISSSNEGVSVAQVDAVSNSMASIGLIGNISGRKGWFFYLSYLNAV